MSHQGEQPQRQVDHANDIIEIEDPVERITVKTKGTTTTPEPSTPSSSINGRLHGTPEFIDDGGVVHDYEEREGAKKGKFAYLRTRDFWIVLLLTQIIALAQTGTNTLTSLINARGTSIPAFQTFFNYVLLNVVYTSFTIYKYGFARWAKMVLKDGWRFFILAFLDVEGNYFIVLAYKYTNLLSAQLFSFWTVIVVVVISLVVLKVRYHLAQYGGIVLACGGFALLIASDYITKSNNYAPANALKGDLFCLLAQTLYAFSNTFEEFLVSKRPMYEVIGQLAFWGMFINGVQAAIFDRKSIQEATWDGQIIGYIVGYTLLLFIFYTLAPIVFRMSSAAFFNIGLLTGTFWGIVVGTQVLGYHIHYLYPIAFVLIILGHFVYYGTEGVLGEAKKPWLGENQELGESGLGTARRRAEHPNAIV
ncbi:DUF914-domain-containing protein [Aureobasidium subglaciale]|nr:DUF914-domain-containing protein [Aureobasidium subglaciale]KAI5276691.1 DUF914-domain-containing protein [Aureobasidium subglaciale]